MSGEACGGARTFATAADCYRAIRTLEHFDAQRKFGYTPEQCATCGAWHVRTKRRERPAATGSGA